MNCTKVTYQSKGEARIAGRALISGRKSRKRYVKVEKLNAYQCDNCLLWHLTSVALKN